MAIPVMTSEQRDARISALEADVARLIRVVDGENGGEINPGITGVLRRVADRVDRNAREIETLERTLDRYRWTIAGAALAGSALGGAIVFLLNQWLGQIG